MLDLDAELPHQPTSLLLGPCRNFCTANGGRCCIAPAGDGNLGTTPAGHQLLVVRWHTLLAVALQDKFLAPVGNMLLGGVVAALLGGMVPVLGGAADAGCCLTAFSAQSHLAPLASPPAKMPSLY